MKYGPGDANLALTTPMRIAEGQDTRRTPIGPCAKTTVRCTLVAPDGTQYVGQNWCANPQPVCPRAPGEGYEKCKSICSQEGHAEAVAVRIAGANAKGTRAYLEGHTYACQNCQETLFGAGVLSLTVGSPPALSPSGG